MPSSAQLRQRDEEVSLRETLCLLRAGGRRTTQDPPLGTRSSAAQTCFAPCASTCPHARRRSRASEAVRAVQRFPCPPRHLRSKHLSSPGAGEAFLLEGKQFTPSLALPARLLAVTHCHSKRQQDQAAEPRGWTDLLHEAERGQAHACMPAAEPARVRVHRQESSRNKVRGDTPPHAQMGDGAGSPAASVVFILPVPASAPSLPRREVPAPGLSAQSVSPDSWDPVLRAAAPAVWLVPAPSSLAGLPAMGSAVLAASKGTCWEERW